MAASQRAALLLLLAGCWTACDATDCTGTWNTCTAACEASAARPDFTEVTAQAGSGAACPTAGPDCADGDGECVITDCAGSWSTCSDCDILLRECTIMDCAESWSTCTDCRTTCSDDCTTFACPDGDILKPRPGTITCGYATACTTATCCNPTCGDVRLRVATRGSEDDDAFAVADCATGLVLKSDPLTIGCARVPCTSNDCCEAATPAATPPPADSSASRAAQVVTAAVSVALVAAAV